jgi:outer membrane protein TolC
VQLAGTVRRARQEVERWREALVHYEETWKSTERLRVAGSLSLIDTLKTEQDLTAARQQYVQAQREFAAAVARFKFETGTLVEYRDGTAVMADLSALIGSR